MKYNIFNYATSELSNDAVLCWILSHADNEKSLLSNLSNDFIVLLTGMNVIVDEIEIYRQYLNTDILVKVNTDIVILIEDKVDSLENGGQLEKYIKVVESEFPGRKKFFNYLTIGDEDNYQRMEELNYNVITRKDMINLLKNYTGESEIISQYFDYLSDIQNQVNSYTYLPINKWSARAWQGYYDYLKNKGIKGNWGKVNPKSGDVFMAFYWGTGEFYYENNKNIEYRIYLQVERDRITFRVGITDDEYKSEVRNYLSTELMSLIGKNSKIIKPNFGYGDTMAFAAILGFETKKDIEEAMLEADNYKQKLFKSLRDKN